MHITHTHIYIYIYLSIHSYAVYHFTKVVDFKTPKPSPKANRMPGGKMAMEERRPGDFEGDDSIMKCLGISKDGAARLRRWVRNIVLLVVLLIFGRDFEWLVGLKAFYSGCMLVLCSMMFQGWYRHAWCYFWRYCTLLWFVKAAVWSWSETSPP